MTMLTHASLRRLRTRGHPRSLSLLEHMNVLQMLDQAISLRETFEPHLDEGRLGRNILGFNRIFPVHPLQERQQDTSHLIVSGIT
jgi:hypothetical protein